MARETQQREAAGHDEDDRALRRALGKKLKGAWDLVISN